MQTPLEKAYATRDAKLFREALLDALKDPSVPLRGLRSVMAAIFSKDDASAMKIVLNTIGNAPQTKIELILKGAGLGQQRGTLKPRIAEVLMKSTEFAKAVHEQDFDVTTAFANLLMRHQDESALIGKFLDTAESVSPGSARHFAKDAFHHSLSTEERNHCFNTGHLRNFEVLADRLTQEDANEIITEVAKLTLSEDVGENLLVKKLTLIAQKADEKALQQAYSSAAGSAIPEVVAVFADHAKLEVSAADALLAACDSLKAGGANKASEAVSLRNLQNLLAKNSFGEDQIFDALQAAISSQRPEHMAALMDYAKTKFPHVVDRTTPDGTTLLVKAVSSQDKKAADRMAHVLMMHNASPSPDATGRNPMSILAQKGLEGSASYHAMKRTMDLGFAEQEEAARMRGRLTVLKEAADILKALGLPPDQMGQVIAGLLGAPSSSEPPKPAVGPHTHRIAKPDDPAAGHTP